MYMGKDFFPFSRPGSSLQWQCYWLYRSFSISWGPIYQLLVLMWYLGLSWKVLLCAYHLKHILFLIYQIQVLMSKFLIYLQLIFEWVRGKHLFCCSCYCCCLQLSSLSSDIYWRCCVFLPCVYFSLCVKSSVVVCVWA